VAETSFPLADGSGVTDASYERLMGPITGNGRYTYDPTPSNYSVKLVYADGTGRQVKMLANQAAILHGFRWESGTTVPVIALDANTSGNPRLDLIVLRLDRSTFQVRLAKITGTPAAVPNLPNPIQDVGTTGVYDIPLASVKVTSSGSGGQPIIQAADVTSLEYWRAPSGVVARNAANIPAVISHGQLVHQIDTGRMYRGVGTSLALVGERGTLTSVVAAAGWSNNNIQLRRVNGWVYFQCSLVSSAGAKAAGTDILACTIPATFRPDGHDITMVAWMSANQPARVFLNHLTGTVTVWEYPNQFPAGGTLTIHPASWPSTN
jgi:hypothetical protein